MDIKLSLPEYVSILAGMKRDVQQSFIKHFVAPANTFPEISTDCRTGIIHLESMTVLVTADLELPFRVEDGQRVIRCYNTARLNFKIMRRQDTLAPWSSNSNAEITPLICQSLDQDGADEVGKAAANLLANLLEPEMEPA